nr:hypothetical protein [Tanacetum cinerariifolium]
MCKCQTKCTIVVFLSKPHAPFDGASDKQDAPYLVAGERGGDGGVWWRLAAMAMGMMWGWKWWRGDDRGGFGGGVAATMRLLRAAASGRNLAEASPDMR